MKKINCVELKNNFSSYLDSVVAENKKISVKTEKGNAVIMNEKEYNGLVETLNLVSNSEIRERLDGEVEDFTW